MSQPKKVVKASSAAPKKPAVAAVKDSTEIDDLFSLLSSSKKTSPVETAQLAKPEATKDSKESNGLKKNKKSKSDEVTVSDLEGLEEEEDDDDDDEECSDTDAKYINDSSEEELVKGVAYDPKKDDIFPATTSKDKDSTSVCDSDFFDSRGLKRKARPLTKDGLPIYSPKELKIGMGGGTDLCPFDCNCCY